MKSAGFVKVENSLAREKKLTYRARGLLVCVRSFPSNWKHSSASLARLGREGRDAIRTTLNELKRHGYCRLKRERREDGKWISRWEFQGHPILPEAGEPVAGEPVAGEPVAGEPVAGKPLPDIPAIQVRRLNRKTVEGKSRPSSPPDEVALAADEVWVARLIAEHPGIDIREQLRLAEAAKRKDGRKLERVWFVTHWLSKCSATYNGTAKSPSSKSSQPEGWREWMVIKHPGWIYIHDGRVDDHARFSDLPEAIRLEALQDLGVPA